MANRTMPDRIAVVVCLDLATGSAFVASVFVLELVQPNEAPCGSDAWTGFVPTFLVLLSLGGSVLLRLAWTRHNAYDTLRVVTLTLMLELVACGVVALLSALALLCLRTALLFGYSAYVLVHTVNQLACCVADIRHEERMDAAIMDIRQRQQRIAARERLSVGAPVSLGQHRPPLAVRTPCSSGSGGSTVVTVCHSCYRARFPERDSCCVCLQQLDTSGVDGRAPSSDFSQQQRDTSGADRKAPSDVYSCKRSASPPHDGELRRDATPLQVTMDAHIQCVYLCGNCECWVHETCMLNWQLTSTVQGARSGCPTCRAPYATEHYTEFVLD